MFKSDDRVRVKWNVYHFPDTSPSIIYEDRPYANKGEEGIVMETFIEGSRYFAAKVQMRNEIKTIRLGSLEVI